MFTHKSIAQAKLKGKIRVSADHEAAVIKSMDASNFSKPLWSHKKGVTKYINSFRDMTEERLIYEQTLPKRTSWHFKHELLIFGKDLFTVDAHPEMGACLGMMLHIFDTRKMMKGKNDAHQMYTSSVFFQQHFLVRFMSRVGADHLGEIGKKIYSVVHWLATENVPYQHIPKDGYFVLPEYALVYHMIPNSEGLLFKTVLIREHMDRYEGQTAFFSKAYEYLDSNNTDVVLINEKGSIVRKTPKQEQSQLNGVDFDLSNWFFDINEQLLENENEVVN